MLVKIILISVCLLGVSKADNVGKCDISGVPDIAWQVSLNTDVDDLPDLELFRSPYTGVLTNLNCTCETCGSNNYILFEVTDAEFILTTGPDMANFDESTPTTSSPASFSYSCTMTCESGVSSLSVQVNVQDFNSHAPTFLDKPYTYSFPSPIMPGIDLTLDAISIEASDLDFSNTNITFTIEPNHFDIFTTKDSSVEKTYVANFRANQVIFFDKTVTYQLTATDNGVHPQTISTIVDITIEFAEEDSIDSPSFNYPNSSVRAFYLEYGSDNKLTGDSITVNTNKASNVADYQLTGEMSESFGVNFDQSSKTFTLTVENIIENPTTPSTVLMLSFKTDLEVSASIIIYFSGVVTSTVSFNRHTYAADYSDTESPNKIALSAGQEITVTSTGTPTVTLDGDYSDQLSVKLDTTTNTYLIEVVEDLTVAQIKEKSYLNLVLTATQDTQSDSASLIVTLPVHTLEFTEILYSAVYNSDDTITISEKPIAFTSGSFDADITVDDAYSEYFAVKYENTEYKMDVIKPLTSDIISSQTELAVILTALDAYENQPQTVVNLKLPSNSAEEAPIFSELYYTIQYNKDQTGFIDFDYPIAFDNVEVSGVQIQLSDYAEYFEVVYDSNKWRINVMNPLNSSFFDNYRQLVSTMEASKTGDTKNGMTVLVVELVNVEQDPPSFEEAYYSAEYPNDGTTTISFSNDIILNNADANKVTINILDYTENFNVAYDKDSDTWYIDILVPLASTILLTETYLTSTLSATIEGDSHVPVAGFVLKLPEIIAPTFSKTYYTAQYTIDGSSTTVTFDDDNKIGFDSAVDEKNIQITADEYSAYFTFTYDDTAAIWQIVTQDILGPNILNNTYVMLAITATDITNKLQDHSVINLNLPEVNTDDSLKFSKTYYTGQYEISGEQSTVALDTPIDIITNSDISQISITTDRYTENFKITYSNGEWVIDVSTNLDETILNSNVDIIMALIASDSSNDLISLATLSLTLPKINQEDAPKFSSIFYETQCYSSTEILDANITITNKDATTVTVQILEDAYRSNFDVQFNEATSSWSVKVNAIPDGISNIRNDLILTLIATDENMQVGQAALVIIFPIIDAPQFDSNQYYAYYANYTDKDSATFSIDPITITNKDNPNDISFSLTTSNSDTDFSRYFTFKLISDQTWTVILSEPIDENDIEGQSELIFTLAATEKDNTNLGFATIIMYIDIPETVTTFTFSEVHYQGDYITGTDNGDLNLTEDVKIVSDLDLSQAEIIFVASDDLDPSQYFTIDFTYSTGICAISVTTPLPSDILQKQRSLAITLEASLNSLKSYATLVVDLPVVGEENSIDFTKLLYEGNYSVISGTSSYTVEDITIVTNEPSANLDVQISSDSSYRDYFEVSQTDKIVTLDLKNQLPDEVLETVAVIPLTLIATSSGTSKTGATVVNINVIFDNGIVKFNAPLYNGIYEIMENGTVVAVVNPIEVTTDQEDDKISVTLDPLKDYFSASYSNSEVTVKKTADVPAEELETISTILMTLTMSIIDTDITSQTVVNLRIVNDSSSEPDTAGFIQFSDVLYTGQYTVTDGVGVYEKDSEIRLLTDRMNEEIKTEISTESEFGTYFTISYKNDIVSVELASDIPEDDIRSTSFISLTLIATIESSQISTRAVLNIRLNNSEVVDTSYISFEYPVYQGNYSVQDNKASLYCADVILDTDQDDAFITVSIEKPYDTYFYTQLANKQVEVKLIDDSDTSVLRNLYNIPVVILAQLKNSEHSATVVQNFEVTDLDNGGEIYNFISFPQLVYNGEYTIQNSQFTTDNIVIVTDVTDDDIEVDVTNDDKYEVYFAWSYSLSEIVISLKSPLPQENLKTVNLITLLIKVSQKSQTTVNAEAVLNVQIVHSEDVDTSYISFEYPVYQGNYSVQDNKASLYCDDVTLNTDQDDVNITVSIEKPYDTYFYTQLANKQVEVKLIDESASSVLRSLNNIPVVMLAQLKNTEHSATVVQNFKVIDLDNGGEISNTINFPQLVYYGEYTVQSSQFTADNIVIVTDVADDDIEVDITNDDKYEDYFTWSYSRSKIGISLKSPLPEENLKKVYLITLLMKVSQKSQTTVNAEAVLNVEIVHNEDVDTSYISFEYPVYQGTYSVQDNKASLYCDNVILDTDQDDANITVSIEKPYDTYFYTELTNKQVEVKLIDESASSVLRNLNNIPVVMLAELNDSEHSATVVQNFKVVDLDNGGEISDHINFPQLVYYGEYTVQSSQFTVDNIVIVTDVADDDIEVDITNDYKYEDYFAWNYSHSEIGISLKSPLPRDNFKKVNLMTLLIKVSERNQTNVNAEAVLNVQLVHTRQKNTINETAYIVAISILAVLIAVLIAATIGFYYYKFRNSKYNKMSEEEYMHSKVRFDKTPRLSHDRSKRSSALEERRPTGFVFNKSVQPEAPRESSTDTPEVERQKSVAFDENVEKIKIEAINDEDIDQALEDNNGKIADRYMVGRE